MGIRVTFSETREIIMVSMLILTVALAICAQCMKGGRNVGIRNFSIRAKEKPERREGEGGYED